MKNLLSVSFSITIKGSDLAAEQSSYVIGQIARPNSSGEKRGSSWNVLIGPHVQRREVYVN